MFWCLCTNKGTPGSWPCSPLWRLLPWPRGSDGHALSSTPAATHQEGSDPPRGCRRRETASDNTEEITFTSLFSIWVEPSGAGSFTDFLLRAGQPHWTQVGSGGLEVSEAKQFPGLKDSLWRWQPHRQVSLSPCNFLSGHIAALVFVIRRSSKPFP